MKKLKELLNIITFNIKTLISFELLFKLLMALILVPLGTLLLKLDYKLTGFTYITLENLFKFLLNPITILILILLIILYTVFTIFDISSLIIIYNKSYNKEKISLMDTVRLSIIKCKNLFKPKNFLICFFVLFLIPFLNISLASNVILSFKIPEFITDFIYNNTLLLTIYILLYIILFIIMSRWLYSLNYMIIEDKDFKNARKLSIKMIKHNIIKDNVKLILMQIVLTLSYILFIGICLLFIYIFYLLFNKVIIIESALITIISIILIVGLLILAVISNSISYALVSLLFYKHKEDNKEEIKYIKSKKYIKKERNIKKILIPVFILIFIINLVLVYNILNNKINFYINLDNHMEVTAHRGASTLYPENTMSAFIGAKEVNADYIELDVQQTKDGKIVVCHDTNLYRVGGVNKDIIDMTYDEILTIDVGSHFDTKFSSERMPLLEDVVKFAKENNIKLNIELKPTGKEVDFEKSVIDIVNKYDFASNSVITSQVYDVLKNVKDYDKNIETVYVMSIAIGNITDLEYADAFSVEASNVNDDLVSLVHNHNKKIYAWTVNTEESINNMIDMGVDNIITDNVTLAKELIELSNKSNIINEIYKKLFK